jgi:hypothetical protein
VRAVADDVAGAEDLADAQRLQMAERRLQGAGVGVDVGDQSEPHGD